MTNRGLRDILNLKRGDIMLNDKLLKVLDNIQCSLEQVSVKPKFAFAMINDAEFGCHASCSGTCMYDCENGCSGDCQGSCTGGCSGDCSGDCAGDCSGDCSGWMD